MDWKIIIVIYYHFQTLQSQHLNRANKIQFFKKSDLGQGEIGCRNGIALKLCISCEHISELVEIHSARSLFVNLTLNERIIPFNVTVKTQKDDSITSRDTFSKTVSSARSNVSFSVDVTEGHRYVIMRLNGDDCDRNLIQAEMYYYFVPEQTRLLTVFPASYAPSESEKTLFVDAKCAPNATSLKKPTMKIYSNGTFVLQGSCECKPGFQKNGRSCSGCPPSKFKAEIGNEACVSCPANTIQLPNGIGCNCPANFYRAANQKTNYSSDCYGPLLPPSNITATNITENDKPAVLLKWDIGDEGLTTNSSHLYAITCPSCLDRNYRFTAVNSTENKAVIRNLMAYVSYTLQITTASETADLTKTYLSSNIAFTTETGAPGPIENFKERVDDNGNIVLTWDPPVERGGPELKYRFESGVINKLLHSPRYTLKREEDQRPVVYKITAVVFINGKEVPSEHSHSSTDKEQSLPPVVTGKLSTSVVVGVTIAVVIFVIILLIVIVVLYRRTKRPKHLQVYRMEDGSFEIYRGQVDKSRIYVDPGSYSQIDHAVYNFTTELRAADLEIGKLIGEGEFADVHRGVLRVNNKKVEVAVKKLRIGCSQKDREDFISEAAILGQFDNPNVIRLEGVILKATPSILILELMTNGSLDKYLKEHHSKLSIHQLLGMARGVSSGMKYLSDLGYIHRDLAARNVLIDAQENCKISDFGMSRELKTDETYSTRGGKIPIKWTAPEAIQFKKFTTATDVWSYGILLWEIMSFGERPYWDWPNFEVLERIATGYRLPPPPYCPKAVHDLMLDCWQKDRTKRPLFDAILHQLELWIKDPALLKETFRESVITKDDEIFDYASVFGSLEDWLEAIKMSQYTSFFQERGFISPKQLMNFTLEDLQDIGIAPIGHRKKILKAIRTTRFQLAGREGRRRTVSRSSSSIGYARSRIAKRFSNLASSLQNGHNSIMEKSFDLHETIIT